MASSAVPANPGKKRACPAPINLLLSERNDAGASPTKVSPVPTYYLEFQKNDKLAKLLIQVFDTITRERELAIHRVDTSEPVEFLPGVWLGGIWGVPNFDNLATILDDQSMVSPLCQGKQYVRKHFYARDDRETDIMKLFNPVRDYLDSLTQGRTLIHCFAGINRSGTLATAYYMHKTGKPLLEAVAHMVRLRPIILRNECFVRQLVLWAVANKFC